MNVRMGIQNHVEKIREIEKKNKIIIGLATLAAVSVAAGVIVAVKIAKKRRDNLEDEAIETVDTMNDAVQAEAQADKIKDPADEAAEETTAAIEEESENAQAVIKDMDDGIKKTKKDLKKTAETAATKKDAKNIAETDTKGPNDPAE